MQKTDEWLEDWRLSASQKVVKLLNRLDVNVVDYRWGACSLHGETKT